MAKWFLPVPDPRGAPEEWPGALVMASTILGEAAGTGYMGPISTGGNNCNATETSVDWSVGPNQVTFTNMTCRQNEDTTCTTVFTLRDDAADTSATCTTTNNDTCAWSGTVTMAASSLAAIKMSTNTSCTTESNVECDLTFTVD